MLEQAPAHAPALLTAPPNLYTWFSETGAAPLPFLVLIPIVCWARVYLKAHTPLQVIAGAALGAGSTILFFAIFGVL